MESEVVGHEVTDPPKKVYKNVEDGSRVPASGVHDGGKAAEVAWAMTGHGFKALISKNLLVDWDTWMLKVIQLCLGTAFL